MPSPNADASETVAPAQASLGARWRAARRQFVFNTGKKVRKRLIRFFGKQSQVGDPPVFADGDFPFTGDLEANWRTIRGELDRVLGFRDALPAFQEISPDNDKIAVEDRWKVYLLFGFGERSERNCALCPETTRLIESIPGLKTAWFSILSPRYHVPPHRGVTKGLLRCHLGLKIPTDREKCRIRIGQDYVSWENGRAFVFDDTRRHEVFNETDEERVILLLDFDRPMRPLGRLVSRTFTALLRRTAYFRDARRNQLAWEDQFHDALERHQKEAVSG